MSNQTVENRYYVKMKSIVNNKYLSNGIEWPRALNRNSQQSATIMRALVTVFPVLSLFSLHDKRNDTSQLQVKNEFISCRLFHFSFFKKNLYIHFCKKWHSFIWTHTHIRVCIFNYLSSYFLRIFYKINAINGPLHNHYFLSFPYLMKSSCWRKEHTNVRAKLSQDQNSFLQKRSCTKLIYYY